MVPRIILILAVFCGGAFEGQASLREVARTHNNLAQNFVDAEFYPATVPQLVATAQVIVHARVLAVRSELSSNESVVLTFYTLQPLRFLKREDASATSPTRQSLTVERVGGRLVEGPYQYTTRVSLYSLADDLHVGETVVVFLNPGEGQRYVFTAGPYAVFRERDGQLVAMNHDVAERRADPPRTLSEFLAEVERLTLK